MSAIVALGVTIAGMPRVRAQARGGDIELDGFRGAIDSRGFVTANASQTLGRGELSFGLVTDWVYRPLSLSAPGRSTAATYAIDHMISPALQAAFGVGGGLEVGASLPFRLVSGDSSSQGVGDLGLHLKLRLLDTSKHVLGLAVVASAFVPGGYARDERLGEATPVVQPAVVVDQELAGGRLKLAVNLGLRARTGGAGTFTDPGTMQTVTVPRTTIVASGAIAWALVPQKFELVGELFGGGGRAGLSAVGGVKLYLAANSFFLLGGGPGRAFIGILFEPSVGDRDGDGLKDDVDRCPDDPEDRDDFEDLDGCPEPDNDRDLILDEGDKCPNEPEDKDGVQDDDGCPDTDVLDRDGDKIPDAVDKCPDDPEDFDAFHDQDGCPEPDNDGDRILDGDDLCPNDAEDRDGWRDADGCPDPDNDHDRIPDDLDHCKNEPENYNGKEDDDGCPDRTIATRTHSGIDVFGKIYFETDKAKIKGKPSYAILDAVAATILANPDVTLLEVQGHTDSRGDDAYNLRLSQARAEAVRAYLISQGVDGGRLTAKGYGETKPIEPCDVRMQCTKQCAAPCSNNRRVEFVIRPQDGDGDAKSR